MTDNYTELLDEIPHLIRAKAFSDSLSAAPLFSRVGQTLDPADRDLAERYVQNLGFPHIEQARLVHLAEALGAAEASGEDPDAWETEEQLRSFLHMEAMAQTSEEGANALLQLVSGQVSEVASAAVIEHFEHSPHYDEAAKNAMVGHVVQSAHCMALAILSNMDEEQPDHPFILRWSLFNRGRWPVGITGSSFNLF
ncbi:MAG: hypothetical protein COA47_00410 [Robiginitomaculum sp.]|nr:MAG: hypothetical protein COA47_00410 [Robiginitomaculum sp.]